MALAQAAPADAATLLTRPTQTATNSVLSTAHVATNAAIPLAQNRSTVPPPLSSNAFTHYLVTLKPDANPHKWDHELSPTHHFSHALKGFRTRLTAEQYQNLKKDKQVLAIEPDTAIRPAGGTGAANGSNASPNGSGYTVIDFPDYEVIPTGLVRMGVPNFPLAQINGGDHQLNVNVAVLDTGVDVPTYTGWPSGQGELNVAETVSFADTDPPSFRGLDWTGHGTSVSGIIGARNNGWGVVGVAPGVNIYNYQIMTPHSSAWGNFLQAMDYIVANQSPSHNVQVINASIQQSAPGSPYFAISAAIRSVVNLGIVYVNAAGNNGANNGENDLGGCDIYGPNCWWTGTGPTGPGSGNDEVPASVREAMVVSAMDPNPTSTTYDTVASWSNYSGSVVDSDPAPDGSPPNPPVAVHSPGVAIDLSAPGVSITSLFPGGQGVIDSGTSMAAPHVSGLVALYLAANPAPATPDANWVYTIRQALINTGLPQSQWGVTNTLDPDGNPEPLAVVSESWIPKPNILSWSMSSECVQLRFLTVPGYNYTVQYSDSLAQPTWSNLSTNQNTLGSVTTNTVADLTPNPHGRFYRLRRSPTTSTPVLSWPNPAAITYGVALSAAQFNASCGVPLFWGGTWSVPGSFAYSPASGTVLDAGTHPLSVVFTPTCTNIFTSATTNVSLVVLPAPLTVTASDAAREYGAPNPNFTGTITGIQNGDNISATYNCSATPDSPPGQYPIVPSLIDPNNRLGNYTVTTNNGTLTVTCAAIALSPTMLPAATLGQTYSQNVTASGGATPYTFAVTDGSLPTGLSMDTNGVISGTPAEIGTNTFTVTATDGNGCTGSQGYSIVVSGN